MNTDNLKDNIVTNVYYIDAQKNVAIHKHDNHNEIFYCVKGSGYGILEDSEIILKVGDVFNVKAKEMHSLRSDSEMYVASFLIPIIR